LQSDLERGEKLLARARTDAELGAAKLAVAEAATRLELWVTQAGGAGSDLGARVSPPTPAATAT
jgi:hypothetical protein